MRRTRKTAEGLDLSIYTKNGTLRKRKQKVSRDYFTQETEDAVLAFARSEDETERNRLFRDYINYGIYKLAENIINTYKFTYTGLNDIEDLKHVVVVFLLERFHLYDPSKGKAYSYFSKIAFNYLVTYNKAEYKRLKDQKEMEAVDEDTKVKRAAQEEATDNEVSHFVKSYIRFMELSIDDIHENRYKKTDPVTKQITLIKEYVTFSEKDKDIVRTVLDLFRRADELEVFYKPALYLQIREVTKQKTIDITRVVKIMKCTLEQQAKIYYQKGALDIDESDIYNSINIT